MRVSGFGASGLALPPAGGAGASVAGADTAAPSVIGPLPVALLGVELDLAGGQALQIGLRPALRAGLDQRLRRRPPAPPSTGLHRARQRKRRHHAEAFGDRMCGIDGRDRHRRVAAEQLAHAAGVDDDVVAELDRPLLQEGAEVRQVGAAGSGGSSITSTLPPLAT